VPDSAIRRGPQNTIFDTILGMPMPIDNEYLTDPLALAVLFHVTYERLAPQKGYETRTETRVFDPESSNGKLMIATCAEIQTVLRGEAR